MAHLRTLGVAVAVAAICASLDAQTPPSEPVRLAHLPVEELRLPNGMRFLLVERPGASSVAAGWVARVGSADEQPGQTGLSHFIEHLLFKGTRTVSARQLDHELETIADLDRAAAELHRLEAKPKPTEKWRRKLDQLRLRFSGLQKTARRAAFLGEFSLLYSQAGATGLNAHTLEDLTMFYVSVPAEKLELWFWLESDRLREPVFREFYKEKQVIREERRLRVGSSPTGRLDESFRKLFWGDLPYAWLPLGEPEDLERVSREDVDAFFSRHFAPANLTAVLVGSFDSARVGELAASYFGRLPAGDPPAAPPTIGAVEPARAPLVSQCDCPPQAQLRYPSVPFRHPDSYRLQVLAGLLNGRTGRLYRSLVLERQIAYSASVLQHPLRRAGSFLFVAEARGADDPLELEKAWLEEVARLAEGPLEPGELEKVKNQITADAYRRLRDPETLMRQLLIYDGLGDWRHINDWPERILTVGEAEVIDVAGRYLRDGRPARAFYYRSGMPMPTASSGARTR